MKKLQCEVCGSTEIKKISDGIFECQSCGVQYDTSEVKKLLVEITGKVKIDHSEEVENTLKRAEQFEQEGNIQKAEEYYNRVLDIQPENDTASEKIEEIREEKNKPRNLFILKQKISSDEAVTAFLKKLKKLPNIAPDIYKEVSIISKSEKYIPFTVIFGSYSGSYSGTACFRKQVPYQEEVYTRKYINGEFRQVKETVTKYRTEIDKRPASGMFSVKCREMYSISRAFNENFSDALAKKNVTTTDKQKKIIDSARYNMLSEIEDAINSHFSDFSDKVIEIAPDDLSLDIPIDLSPIDDICTQRAKNEYNSTVNSTCSRAARNRVGGDYSEQVRYDWRTDKQNTLCLFVPVQVIEYAYKGDFYYAVTVLTDLCGEPTIIYPYYKKIDDTEEEGDTEVSRITHKGYYGLWSWLLAILFLVFALILGMSSSDEITRICYTLAVGFAILGFLQTTLGVIKLTQAKAVQKEYLKQIQKLSMEKKEELEKEYQIFFASYTDIDSVDKCSDAVRESCSYTSKIDEITCRSSNDYWEEEEDEEEEEEEDYDE